MKQVKRLMKAFEKGKPPPQLEVRDRQEIVTTLFESRIRAIGLEPSMASGHVPLSQTPLARFLRERGLPEDVVEAVVSGVAVEETEAGVRSLIEAASEALRTKLQPDEVRKAQNIAVEEWRRHRLGAID